MFQFTHPVWGATLQLHDLCSDTQRFNSRPPCGVRHFPQRGKDHEGDVSIHAPRVGCDILLRPLMIFLSSFNSRTPCGVRRSTGIRNLRNLAFQFTHPVWGATPVIIARYEVLLFQFTHPVWGATDTYKCS